MNISVTAVVYNEEARIGFFLESLRWSDDVIIVDKSSTDRTVEIAKSYGAKVIVRPYSDTGDEGKYALEVAKNEWVLFLVASDMVHPALADKLLELVNRPSFDYDVIAFPYMVGSLGVFSPHSPWDYPSKPRLARKSVIVCSSTVHKEVSFSSERVYKLKMERGEAIYHFTHQTLDTFFERHIRYTKAEAQKSSGMAQGLLVSLGQIFAAVGCMGLVRRTWLLGWDGLALMIAFTSYFMMKFLYTWERFRGNGDDIYKPMKRALVEQWRLRTRNSSGANTGKLITIAISSSASCEGLELALCQLLPELKRHEEDVELIICDNASSDVAKRLVERYLASGFQMRLIVGENKNADNPDIAWSFKEMTGRYLFAMHEGMILQGGSLETILSTLRGRDIGVLSIGSYDSRLQKDVQTDGLVSDKIFADPAKFIAGLSFIPSFGSVNIVNRDGLDFSDAEELSKSSIAQVYYSIRAAYLHKENIVIGQRLVALKHAAGIDPLQAHGVNFFSALKRLSREYVAPEADFSPVKRRMLMRSLPALLLRERTESKGDFDARRSFLTLFKRHWSHWAFWLFTVPAVFMPGFIARKALAIFHREALS